MQATGTAAGQSSIRNKSREFGIATADKDGERRSGGILAGMTDADLARTLAQAGFMEPLAKQVANFLQLAEQS